MHERNTIYKVVYFITLNIILIAGVGLEPTVFRL